MKAEELRNLSIEELRVRLVDMKNELFKLTHQLMSRQMEDTNRRMLTKREIARILTVMNEKIKAGDEVETKVVKEKQAGKEKVTEGMKVEDGKGNGKRRRKKKE
ncbi:MAG: 50S ribosomal protein L29 [Candidatus Coatesbacteria bacterium]|nr:MAG: 50S ribosomal protein L29 [Candidatus Coatesbacteria bacterium]RLC41411.1 MAG: 50S ribosomal protein L29 [Candidatus Coatesbacteria bacterium]HEC79805.1 50S ribosomal protein L29 [Bacillota bacterium]